MAFLQWPIFSFFDASTPTDNLKDSLENIQITTCTNGEGQIIVGDNHGNIHFITRSLEVTTEKAYNYYLSHLFHLKKYGILVSVGIDDIISNIPIVKVWNLDKIDKDGNTFICRTFPIKIPNQLICKVTSLSVHDNLSYMAFGLESGTIIFFRGDITRERHSKSTIIYEGPHSITGLCFCSMQKESVLFATTEYHVLSIGIGSKDRIDDPIILDQQGCIAKCVILFEQNNNEPRLVVARQEALYFYEPKQRGPCIAVQGKKELLYSFRNYIVIVSEAASSTQSDMSTISIYDIENKLTAFTSPLPKINSLISEWGSLYLFCGLQNEIHKIDEKDTHSKLEVLFKKKRYELAIQIAENKNYEIDKEGLINIYRQFGDYYYNLGDFDNAMTQYIKTIGKFEASYVIRKYLDSSRIHNLTDYLEELHNAKLANNDHTSLLLNCYTRLPNRSRLDTFINGQSTDFDVETAIKVCRNAGFFQHALKLALLHKRHNYYLKIVLENTNDYKNALDYLGRLKFEDALETMKEYGKILLKNVPEQTTALLKRLCTDYRPFNENVIQDDKSNKIESIKRASPDEFIHIFVDDATRLVDFLQHMINVDSGSQLVYGTLLELLLQEYVHEKNLGSKVEKEHKILDLLKNENSKFDLHHALVLCQMNNFKSGILYLYEKAGFYQQLVRHHMENKEYSQIISTCKKYGKEDPGVWVQALTFLAKGEEDNCHLHMKEVLAHIELHNLLPPLLVVQTLSHNSNATLSIIKDYIVKHLQREKEEIEDDERLIKKYADETVKMRNDIENLSKSAIIFQSDKCSICSHPLDLPTVHFLCQHSFHENCFESYVGSNDGTECPVCLADNRKFLEMFAAQERNNKDLYDKFKQELKRNKDGFSVVAEYFGKSIFTKNNSNIPSSSSSITTSTT